jgi:uncharacterized protein
MDHMERHSGTMRGLGMLLNVAAILAGASAGTLLGDRLPQRLRDTLVAALGLFTLALGVQQAQAAFGDDLAGAAGRSAPLLVLGALLAGGLAGEAVELEEGSGRARRHDRRWRPAGGRHRPAAAGAGPYPRRQPAASGPACPVAAGLVAAIR